MHLFLVRDIALQIYKCLSTPGEGAELHLQKQPPYFITRIRARTVDMSRAAFLPYQLSATKEQPTICGVGIEVKSVAEKINGMRENGIYTISMELYKFY